MNRFFNCGKMALAFAVCSTMIGFAGGQAPSTPSSWSAKVERTVNGPEAALLVRTGDINNLGFGWPNGFDPFSGKSTPGHGYPWDPRPGAPDGTDRILLGSVVTAKDANSNGHDGYTNYAIDHRASSMPVPITLNVGALPAKVDAVLLQMFLDDFQAPVWGSHFQVTLNGTRIPSFEAAINSLQQTGPIGKLVSFKLLPEYWPLLRTGTVKVLIDDPTTHKPDGYAIDFVRILVNPRPFKYAVSLNCSVVDAATHKPIAGATVEAAIGTVVTDANGKCVLKNLPAGLVTASANAAGYDEKVIPVDIEAGATGQANFELQPHKEGVADLERAVGQSGSAAIYGVRFDTNSATLRPESTAALENVLTLINNRANSHWVISGHTDNQGSAELNQKLSQSRAASVIAWLVSHGVAANRLTPQGFGASHPVADNSTEAGRAMNRRVEMLLVK
ncbi:MAG: OmpA family protein [Terracidiphilus sp.]|jgi:outer membrane protein OmpA-like peptidoglycan-associated protein